MNACPVCSTTRTYEEASLDGATLYRCADCAHRFSRLAPTDSRLETYADSYYDDEHANWFRNPNTPLFDWIAARIRERHDRPSILDVGCGHGALLTHLQQSIDGASLTGIDPFSRSGVAGIEFHEAGLEDFHPEHPYDVVTSLATIEHIEDAASFVGHLRRVCAPGGTLITMTLNDDSVLYRAARALRRIGLHGAHRRLYDPHHVNHFSVRSLSRLLEQSGLGDQTVLRHNIPFRAVDIPPGPWPVRAIHRLGVTGCFLIGKATGQTYLQTVVCRTPGRPQPAVDPARNRPEPAPSHAPS